MSGITGPISQDWTPVVLKNSKLVKEQQKQARKSNPIVTSQATSTGQKIKEDGEAHAIPLVGKIIAQQILQGRTAKKWKQKDVANKINMPVVDYQKIENGTAIRNMSQIQKICRVLGIRLTKKIIK